MELEELKGLPMVKINQVPIEFELTDENIEEYRNTFDEESVVIVYFEDEDIDDSKVYIGGDLCDVLYDVRDEISDCDSQEYSIYYCDRWETKNFDGNDIDLVGAAVEAYAAPEDRGAEEMSKTVVCFEDDICFVMEYNSFEDEISQDTFDELWAIA